MLIFHCESIVISTNIPKTTQWWFSCEKHNEEKMTGSMWFCVFFFCFSLCNGNLPFYLKGKWDNKKKNKSFWQNFRKSQHKPVVRQSSKGLRASYFSTSVSWLQVFKHLFLTFWYFPPIRRGYRLRGQWDHHERWGADPADDDGERENDHSRRSSGSGRSRFASLFSPPLFLSRPSPVCNLS